MEGKEELTRPGSLVKRETESADDFERPDRRDTSPLEGVGGKFSGKTDEESPGARDAVPSSINNRVENTEGDVAGISEFDPVGKQQVSKEKPTNMDTNLLEMGDAFPDRKEADDKLDKFLSEISHFAPGKDTAGSEKDTNEIKSTESFLCGEIGGFAGKYEPNKSAEKKYEDLLDRYSDSDPEDEFRPTKASSDYKSSLDFNVPSDFKPFEHFKPSEEFKPSRETKDDFEADIEIPGDSKTDFDVKRSEDLLKGDFELPGDFKTDRSDHLEASRYDDGVATKRSNESFNVVVGAEDDFFFQDAPKKRADEEAFGDFLDFERRERTAKPSSFPERGLLEPEIGRRAGDYSAFGSTEHFRTPEPPKDSEFPPLDDGVGTMKTGGGSVPELVAEEKRVAEEKWAAEQKRADEDKRAAEQKRVAEEKRAAEQKKADEEKRAAEQKRVAEEKKAAEQKKADEEKRAAEQKRAEEEKRAAEQKKSAEEKVPEDASKKEGRMKPKYEHVGAEAFFFQMGLDAWFKPECLNPRVEGLIYWRDPKKSGPVFGGVLVVLLALTYFSLISVVAYLSLIGLAGTVAFRVYKNIVQAVQKTGDGHPFKEFLEYDLMLSQDKVNEIAQVAVAHINAALSELRRLFLVEDLVDSIKFGVFLWCLTYLGAWFNGMTLIIIGWVALFTLPKVYETNKTQIDANLDLVRTKLAEITTKVKAAIPIGKKAEKDEKKE